MVVSQVYYSDWISDMKPLEDWTEVAGSPDRTLQWIKRVLEYEGLPGELAWLAAVESGFDPNAVSQKGAVGLFQLMPETAKLHGLRVQYPDERYDPLRNAQAAARFLRSLYVRFGDWTLVFAAYNAGENRVARLVRTKGGDYDRIASHLPPETRSYVPRVKALIEYHGNRTVDEIRAPFYRYGGLLVASDRVP
jgi:membrane-bound lytic murein transglycosylase D